MLHRKIIYKNAVAKWYGYKKTEAVESTKYCFGLS